MFNQFVQVEDDNKSWRVFRKFFIAGDVKFKYDFSDEAKKFKIPYKDGIDSFAKKLGLGGVLDQQLDKVQIPKLSE